MSEIIYNRRYCGNYDSIPKITELKNEQFSYFQNSRYKVKKKTIRQLSIFGNIEFMLSNTATQQNTAFTLRSALSAHRTCLNLKKA